MGCKYRNVFIIVGLVMYMKEALDDLDVYLSRSVGDEHREVVGIVLERIEEGIKEGATLEEIRDVCSKYSIFSGV